MSEALCANGLPLCIKMDGSVAMNRSGCFRQLQIIRSDRYCVNVIFEMTRPSASIDERSPVAESVPGRAGGVYRRM